MFFSSAHRRACASKQKEREHKIDSAPSAYSAAPTLDDQKIYALSLSQLASECKSYSVSPSSIMLAYGKRSIRAHRATNCLSDMMFQEALTTTPVTDWGRPREAGANDSSHPLMGVPVSIKDTVDIAGYDSTIGYSCNVGKPAKETSPIVRLLQDAGALIHVKTTVPTALLAIETTSDLFGRTTNPHNSAHTPGASTGGGAALVASGGCKIEVGSDIAGSIRVPAHFCGIWSLKGSAGRFPSYGNRSSLPGLEAIPLIVGPMANSLDDLTEFWKRVVEMEPWQYDHTCVPLPWKPINLQGRQKRLKFGVIWEDGVVPPAPACRRALSTVVNALKKQGHEVIDFEPPSIIEGLKIGHQLIFSDGGKQLGAPLQSPETLAKPGLIVLGLLKLPKLIKSILSVILRSRILSFIFGLGSRPDPLSAGFYSILHTKTTVEERQLVEERDVYRAEWHKKWIQDKVDFVLTVPYPLPALEHGGGDRATLMAGGYPFIFNLLDYPAGVLPVTKVSPALDALPADYYSSPAYKQLNAVARGALLEYNAEKMKGLPLGIQIVGRRLEEEKVLAGMKVVEDALKEYGVVFGTGNLG